MEKDKIIKIRLPIFFLISAIIIICIIAIVIYKLNNEKIIATEEVNQLNNPINDISNTNEITETDIEETITDISYIINLLKNKGNYEYLRIKDIKEYNKKYLVDAEYYVPTPITEKEYYEMVNNKKIILNSKEYVFENSNETYNTGYGYVYTEGETVENGYWIEKSNEGYIFIHEIGGVYNIINEIKEHYLFYLDKDIEVSEVASIGEVDNLEKYLSEYKDLDNSFMTVIYDNKLRVVVDNR